MKNPLATVVCLILAPAACGCLGEGTEIGTLEVVWGRRGVSEGRLQKPRAVAIDAQDRIYIVDMTARIQVFNTDGRFLRGWRTPRCEKGKPTGLAIGRGGNVLVADTHYYRLLVYSPEGKLLQTIGGVAGQKPGQFIRPESLAIDRNDHIWVADACNHRIQVFDSKGNLIRFWGTQGAEPGKLHYPYDLVLDPTKPFASVSTATIACKSPRATVARSAAGEHTAASKDNCTTPGAWSAIAKEGSTCSTATTTGCNG